MVTAIITYALTHFSLVAFGAGVVLGLLNRAVSRGPAAPGWEEQLFRWIMLGLGVTAIYAFVMHAFFPDLSAATIGWQNSPFQFEVAMANLGFGVIALLAFSASWGFRLAALMGNTCWLWGDAVGHIIQMRTQDNFAAGNAGSWFWMDIVYPLTLILLLVRMQRMRRRGSV